MLRAFRGVGVMRRRTFLIESSRGAVALSVLALTGCGRGSPAPAADEPWKPLVAELDALISRWMAEDVVPGVSVAVVQNAQLVWRKGFGVRDAGSKAPVDDSTVFEAQSMSKPVFAYLVMKLREKGVLELDKPLSTYAAPLAGLEGDPRAKLITARHVLSHTTGLPNWRSKEEPLRFDFTPGEKYRYSGEGYSYLQSVVTHLTGGHVDTSDCGPFELGVKVCATDIDAYIKANVLSPLGMTSSGYFWDEALEPRLARRHDASGAPMRGFRPTRPAVARYASAGGLLTTPSDYAKFVNAVLEPRDGDPFRLSRASVTEMLTPQVKVDGAVSWALGWAVAHPPGGDVIFHAGGTTGAHCLTLASVPRKTAVIVMTNGQNGYKLIEKLKVSDVVTKLL
jgi:CubicO group peptidase (beta-lactamase class C family)